MKHLILGSSGQIGQYLVAYLQNKNEEVDTYDITDYKDFDLRLDNNLLLLDKVKSADIVYFLAFDIGGSKYMEKYQDTYEFIENNVKIMKNTFAILKNTGTPFIFASSQMSNMTHSTYGVLKCVGEKYTNALNGINVKFWNVYGYETNEEKSHVITDFINMAKKDNCIKMRTDGNELRQFLFGEDCANALYTIAIKYASLERNKNYHITSFKWSSINEIADIIKKLSNCNVIKCDKVDNVQRGMKNEPDPFILNYWAPRFTLDMGIKMLYNT